MRSCRIVVVVAVAVAFLAARPQAHSHPDLSGKWTLVDPVSPELLGQAFTATQDMAKGTLEIVQENNQAPNEAPRPGGHMTYSFNGGETQATYPPPARFANLDPTRILWMYRAASSSRAAWRGDQLVIVTHNRNKVNMPNRTPSEFESEVTVQLTLTVDGSDQLTVEQVTIADPDVDVDLPMRVNLPGVIKTAYKKIS